jgi:hypothetical protein
MVASPSAAGARGPHKRRSGSDTLHNKSPAVYRYLKFRSTFYFKTSMLIKTIYQLALSVDAGGAAVTSRR